MKLKYVDYFNNPLGMVADEAVKAHQEALSNKLEVASLAGIITRWRESDHVHHYASDDSATLLLRAL